MKPVMASASNPGIGKELAGTYESASFCALKLIGEDVEGSGIVGKDGGDRRRIKCESLQTNLRAT